MTAGQPTKYRRKYIEQVEKLCKLGATDVEMADFFGCAVSTFYKWQKDFPKFSEAIKNGKIIADLEVANALFNRAVGYERKEVVEVVKGGETVEEIVTKFYPPDTTAQIFWMKNRRKDDWREKSELEISEKLTPEERADRIAELEERLGRG